MQLVVILSPRLIGTPDPEKTQERMRVALKFTREGPEVSGALASLRRRT